MSNLTSEWERLFVQTAKSVGDRIRNSPFLKLTSGGYGDTPIEGILTDTGRTILRDLVGVDPLTGKMENPEMLLGLGFGGITKSLATPKNTQKAYKLFKTQKNRPGELFPLFVKQGEGESIPLGDWYRAESGILTPQGKVKSSLGPLAYRPGWHAGDAPMATHIGEGGQPPKFRPANQVWAEVDLAADVDWQKVAAERAKVSKAGNLIARTAHITDQVPYGGFYRYKTNPNMTGEWLIGGDMRVNRILSDEEVAAANATMGYQDLPRRSPLDLGILGF